MYIIPTDWPEPHNDAHVICFFSVSNFGQQGAQKTVFICSSSAHRQDGPHVYYTKMMIYLDIHETFLILTSKLSADDIGFYYLRKQISATRLARRLILVSKLSSTWIFMRLFNVRSLGCQLMVAILDFT